MSETPLFQNTDDQEKAYAPQEVPGSERSSVDDRGGDARTLTDRDAPVPVASIGGVVAAPASENYAPGMERESRDIANDDE